MSLPAEAQRMRTRIHSAIDGPHIQPSHSSLSAAGDEAALRRERKSQANRRNARHSTGPISETGKAVSSLNALKTGLTGRTVLLHSDDADCYRQHLAAYAAEYQPHGLREHELVQSMADSQWRLAGIPALELALYTTGRADMELATPGRTTPFDGPLSELNTFLKHERQLRNLHLQEARLLRRYQRDRSELRILQDERARRTFLGEAPAAPSPASESETACAAAGEIPRACESSNACCPAASRAAAKPAGFEFSNRPSSIPSRDKASNPRKSNYTFCANVSASGS